jgi:dihydrodipicolinate reductase
VIELHHSARSALPYAEGAMIAAGWILGRKGVYHMDDVAEETLHSLFQEVHP